MIITPLKVSSLSDHATSTPPATIQLANGMIWASLVARMSRNTKTPSTAANSSAPQVISCEPRSPIARPKKPTMTEATSGRKTTAAANASAPHHVDVFDPDCAAIAKVDHENCKPDRCFRCRHRQHEHCKGLADEVVEKNRERDEVDADREQHQLDRHQHDDHVLAVKENAKDTEREQDRGHRQIMRKADCHQRLPLPTGTLTTSTD